MSEEQQGAATETEPGTLLLRIQLQDDIAQLWASVLSRRGTPFLAVELLRTQKRNTQNLVLLLLLLLLSWMLFLPFVSSTL